MIEKNGHRYDRTGVCIYCDKCQDSSCCSEANKQCERTIVKELAVSMEKVHEHFQKKGRL